MTKFSRGKGSKNWHSLCLVGMQIGTIFLEGDLEIFNKSCGKIHMLCVRQIQSPPFLPCLHPGRLTQGITSTGHALFPDLTLGQRRKENYGQEIGGGKLSTYSPGTFPVWPPSPTTVYHLKVHFIIPCFGVQGTDGSVALDSCVTCSLPL